MRLRNVRGSMDVTARQDDIGDCMTVGWCQIIGGRVCEAPQSLALFLSPACSAQRRDLPYLPWLSTTIVKAVGGWREAEGKKERARGLGDERGTAAALD